MGRLSGKTALVTGASRGIGRAVAERLAADGAAVAVHYARDDAAAKEVVERIVDGGGRATAIAADFTADGALDQLFAGLERWWGEDAGTPLDILVNNAGVVLPEPIEQVGPELFEELFAVNVRTPFFLTQRALPLIPDGGRIINMSSVVTRVAFVRGIAYSMTKGALDVFTRTLARHVGTRGITVNAVAPGITDTDVNAWLKESAELEADAASLSTFNRLGQPDDIAGAVAFLASDDARWVSGHCLDVSGGSHL